MAKQLTYAEKLRICAKEARITVVALAAIIVVWLVCGFGLAGIDAALWGIPLWAFAGTVGTWVFAIIVAAVLSKRVFADFDLDDAEGVADGQDGEVGHA